MKLYLIRHAQTNANSQGLTQGAGTNEPLSSLGRSQAEAVARYVQKERIEALFSSPSKRALETAEAINQGINIPIETLPEIHERNWGDWNMQPWRKTQQMLEDLPPKERYTSPPPNGESEEQMVGRLKTVIERLKTIPAEGVVLVTHLAVLRILIPILLNDALEKGLGYNIGNASTTILKRNDDTFNAIIIGDTSYLS